jgi:hypothetical protein
MLAPAKTVLDSTQKVNELRKFNGVNRGIPYFLISSSSLNRKRVEKLAPPQKIFINRAKLHFFTDPLPIVTNSRLDPLNHRDRCLPEKQEMMRSRKAGFELTDPVFAGDEHGLGRFIAGTTLRANIIRRRQGQLLAIPKSGVIVGVIIGIAAQDIKNQPAIWL